MRHHRVRNKRNPAIPKEEKKAALHVYLLRNLFHVQDLSLTLVKPANVLLPGLVHGKNINLLFSVNYSIHPVNAKARTAEK